MNGECPVRGIKELKHVKGLDTYRAFAVLFVIIQHWGPPFSDKTTIGRFIRIMFIPDGGVGVFMFFVLSGFLITSILLQERFNTGSKSKSLKNFYLRRVLRIFPLYYILLFIVAALNYYPGLRDNFWYFFTYTSNVFFYRINTFGPYTQTWTLAIEEQFYLIWPWLMFFAGRKYLWPIFFALFAVGFLSTYFYFAGGHIVPWMTYHCGDAFALGAMYAYARLSGEERRRQFEKIVFFFVPVALVLYFARQVASFRGDVYFLLSVKKCIQSFLSLWIIILICNNRSTIVRRYLLENKTLNFFGKISYCIYLVHTYAEDFNTVAIPLVSRITQFSKMLNTALTGRFFTFILDLTAVILISWLSYVCIEQPVLRLKKYFRYSREENA